MSVETKEAKSRSAKTIKAPGKKSFIERTQEATGKAITQEAKSQESQTKKTQASAQQPTKVVKQVVKRRPNLTSWSQLGIKIGQELTFKDNPEIKAIVQSEVTMELEVNIPGEPTFRTPGVMVAEKKIGRAHV